MKIEIMHRKTKYLENNKIQTNNKKKDKVRRNIFCCNFCYLHFLNVMLYPSFYTTC